MSSQEYAPEESAACSSTEITEHHDRAPLTPPSVAAKAPKRPADPTFDEYVERWWLHDPRIGFPNAIEVLTPDASPDEKTQATRVFQAETAWLKSYLPEAQDVEKQWVQYVAKHGGETAPFVKSATLKKLVRKGVPPLRRPKVWFECSGGATKKAKAPSDYYSSIAARAEGMMDSETAQEIDLDIARTFPHHPFFATSKAKYMLRRLLLSYSLRDPKLGYCQNLTYIAAMMLLFLPEEDAFWMLAAVLEDILPKNFCSSALMGLRIDQKVLGVLIQEKLPSKIHHHFVQCQMDISAITTSWLLRVFVDVFPMETTLRVWDCMLNEGSKVLFRVALAFLKLNETAILRSGHVGELLNMLNHESRTFFDCDRLIKAATGIWNLSRKTITELRNKFLIEVMAEDGIEEVKDDDDFVIV